MPKDHQKNDKNTDELILSDLGVNKDKRKSDGKVSRFKNINIRYISIAVLIILLIMTAIYVLNFINFNSTVLIWRTSLTKGSDSVNNKSVSYASFRNGLMRISNDGITYIDDTGHVNWTVSYNMKEPIYVSNKKYFSIADRNGNNFYIFDSSGLVGENTTTNAIERIDISYDGVLYVLQSDENSSYINVFRNNGATIDLMIKTNLTEDGMPVDISTSRNGEELVLSYAVLDDDNIYSKATYYNFADEGKNASSKRIVGEFIDEFDGKFLARVHFFNDDRSCLIYDGGIYFVSTSDKTNPRVINKIAPNDNMKSISYNDSYLAVVYESDKLIVYDDSGNIICDKQIDYEYNNFYLNDDYIIFLYNYRVMIYDIRGRMIFDKELSSDIQFVAKKKSFIFTELLLGLVDSVECIRCY